MIETILDLILIPCRKHNYSVLVFPENMQYSLVNLFTYSAAPVGLDIGRLGKILVSMIRTSASLDAISHGEIMSTTTKWMVFVGLSSILLSTGCGKSIEDQASDRVDQQLKGFKQDLKNKGFSEAQAAAAVKQVESISDRKSSIELEKEKIKNGQ